MKQPPRLPALALACIAPVACTFTSTAKQWHHRVGPNGRPVYIKSHTTIGINLAVVFRVLGATSLPTQIDVLTEDIAEEGGDHVRMIESSSENYWYGFAPFTWIFTPVVTTVAAEYEPAADPRW